VDVIDEEDLRSEIELNSETDLLLYHAFQLRLQRVYPSLCNGTSAADTETAPCGPAQYEVHSMAGSSGMA